MLRTSRGYLSVFGVVYTSPQGAALVLLACAVLLAVAVQVGVGVVPLPAEVSP